MGKYTVIEKDNIPQGEKITPNSMMPKLFVCVDKKGARLFSNRKLIKRFIHKENAIKTMKLFLDIEYKKANRILKRISSNKGILIRQGNYEKK